MPGPQEELTELSRCIFLSIPFVKQLDCDNSAAAGSRRQDGAGVGSMQVFGSRSIYLYRSVQNEHG